MTRDQIFEVLMSNDKAYRKALESALKQHGVDRIPDKLVPDPTPPPPRNQKSLGRSIVKHLYNELQKNREFVEHRDSVKSKLKPRLRDQRWRLNNLYWIVDPYGRKIKFKMNRVQKILHLGLWYNSVILKSRQHGITTYVCLLFLDTCLFTPNIHAAIIAHTRLDAEDFFTNKIKFAYDNLDNEIKYAVTSERSSTRKLQFSNGSSITVTTSGRSGTYQMLHISEFGKICAKYPEKAREIVTGSLNTVHPGNWIIIESTAEGNTGEFYTICKEAEKLAYAGVDLTKMDFKFFFFGWYLNPLNVLKEPVPLLDYQEKYFKELELKHGIHLKPEQKYWYVKKWNRQGDDMKREHPSTPDEAFESSVVGAYYAANFRRLRANGQITNVPHQPGILVDTWWDIGMSDSTAIWFTQNVGREIHVIRYYENADEGDIFYKREVLDYFAEKYGYKYGSHTAPFDIMAREWGNEGKTRYESCQAIGLNFNVAYKLRIQTGIECVRRILSICWFDEKNCTQLFRGKQVGIPSLENYRKEWDEKLQTYKRTPLHDWSSHGADAFRVLATEHKFTPLQEVLRDMGTSENKKIFSTKFASSPNQGNTSGKIITPQANPSDWFV